jgi:hypothetical protein
MGDLASVQAVTGVNAEQASKRAMRKPTRLNYGEGRRRGHPAWPGLLGRATGCSGSAGVMATACTYMEI